MGVACSIHIHLRGENHSLILEIMIGFRIEALTYILL